MHDQNHGSDSASAARLLVGQGYEGMIQACDSNAIPLIRTYEPAEAKALTLRVIILQI